MSAPAVTCCIGVNSPYQLFSQTRTSGSSITLAKFMHSKKYAWFVAPSPNSATATRPCPLADSAAPVAAAIEPPTMP